MTGLNGDASPLTALVGCPLPLMGEAIAAIVAAHGGRVVAHVGDAAAARQLLDGMPPALAVLDFGPVGVDLLRAVRRAGVAVRVILFVADDAPYLAEAVALGVDGLLPRAAPLDTVRACIGGVAAGGQWLAPGLMQITYTDAERPAAAGLTRREQDVARLVATGQRNRGIAAALGISEGTVKMHLHNVYAKLGLETRTQLAMDARLRALG